MKKMTVFVSVSLLCLLGLMVLTGCQSATETTTTTTAATTTTTAAATTTTSAGATTTTTAGTGTTTSTAAGSTTTTTVAAGATFSIRGLAVTVGGAGVYSVRSAAIANALVEIKIGSAGAASLTTVATGMTDASGKFDVEVDSTRIPSAIISANGIVPQVVVVVSGEGNQVGGVLPAVATSEGAVGHVIADANNASKSLLLEKMIAAGVSPKDIDPTFLDKGFSGVELSSAQAEAIGPIIKNMVNAENGFAASLFESATGESEVSISNLLADDRKEKRDAYREVMEPSLQDAYESGTAPEQVELDILLGSMEAGVQNYLADSYGVSPQQVADLTNIKAAQVLYNMGVDVNLDPEETTVRDVLRRLKGDKFRALYVAWHQAANTLATVSTLGSTSYAEEYPEAYDNFVASKEVTLATIGNLVNNSSIPSDYWQTYLDIIYGEQISLPTQEAPANDAPIASWEAAYIPYVASRPLPYFLMTFFAQFDRQAYNGDFVIPAQAIFTNRMNNDSSEYYIGGNVWAQGPDEIASRLQAYNAALNGAVHGDSNFKTIVQNKFGQENARTILKALRVLTAPVQSW